MSGNFYSFDGVDGAGKSTQIDLFVQHLQAIGHDVVRCRDPGTTSLGEKLRGILLHRHDTIVGMRAEMLIYMAARAEMTEQIILPALERGQTVVSDRFLMSNVAYQGYGGGLDIDEIKHVGVVATANRLPDLTFVLDLPTQIARKRSDGSPDRIEARGDTFFLKVRDGFLREAELAPDRVIVINGECEIAEVHQQIVNAFAERTSAEA